MRLKNIKLSGFKSFVDPTLIPIESFLTGIVGPNGCGKSNVVDAVRWVIGESSAKQLRGQSMTDVIFNGATTRKPVGRASVELIFDHCTGRLTGDLGKLDEISIRREVFREGNSRYFLNGTSCRRRDIIDVFLGTGVGSRSYSIVAQGDITEIVDAKPEDLRLHLEEVSGISKYRERRRETENRMQHTQENLERIHDINEELAKQLRHLKRQADAAEKYTELKQEERQLQATVKGLQWRSSEEQLQTQKQQLVQLQTQEEGFTTDLRTLETELEKRREDDHLASLETNQVQKEYYEIGAEIGKLEQQIQHRQERIVYIQKESLKLSESSEEFDHHIKEQYQKVDSLSREYQDLLPQSSVLKSQVDFLSNDLTAAEEKMKHWQTHWESLQREMADLTQKTHIARVNLQHYKQQLENLLNRREQIQMQLDAMPLDALNLEIEPLSQETLALNNELESLKTVLSQLAERITEHRQKIQQLQISIENQQRVIQGVKNKYHTLEALQKAALGYQNNQTNQWLEKNAMTTTPRLGEVLKVQKGWEIAVETVLTGLFEAICLESLESVLSSVPHFEKGQLILLEKKTSVMKSLRFPEVQDIKTLSHQVETDWPVQIWLENIYLAENFEEALRVRTQLAEHESIITPQGVWMGKNWIKINKGKQEEGSVLLRERELKELSERISQEENNIERLKNLLRQQLSELKMDEEARDTNHQKYQKVSMALTDSRAKLSGRQSQLNELRHQNQHLQNEYKDITQQIDPLQILIEETIQLSTNLQAENEHKQTIKNETASEGETYRHALDMVKQRTSEVRQQNDDVLRRLASIENQIELLKQSVEREVNQLTQLQEKQKELAVELADTEHPLQGYQQSLQEQLTLRLEIEKQLKIAEAKLAESHQYLEQLTKNQRLIIEKRDQVKQAFQDLQLEYQKILTRQSTIVEQLQEQNIILEELLPTLPVENNAADLQTRLEDIHVRVQRLGAINLAAVEEYKTVNERKEYLDKQQADLNEALEILKGAILKIDRETRTKFEETFNQVNEHFQVLFPQIFGGGKAYLELTELEWLTAGVMVKAQPPGKRNSTIHMLSGGEKALTAVALVFALFRLNPAPFCILDEVDAPLDDVNVGRFCNLVREMAKTTQFIIISHNKVTISMAERLMGVTMQEAGVSRIVSVNVSEAVAMAVNE